MEIERQRLEQMIINNASYEEILKQSKILDEYINECMKITMA